MQQIAELGLPGYAIGGLAVGETAEEMYDIIEALDAVMPADKAALSDGRRGRRPTSWRRSAGCGFLRLRHAGA